MPHHAPLPSTAQRPVLRCLLWLSAALLTVGCSSSPPVRLYQLRAEPMVSASSPAPTGTGLRWAVGPVSLPDYLDRDAIVRPVARAGLSADGSQRWAEPLRDVVPRLLSADLARLRGTEQVWRAPAPAGAGVERVLRVEFQRFDAREDGRTVVLQARWMLIDPSARVPARVHESRLEAPCDDPSTDALAAAHRQALWLLAQDIQQRTQTP